MLKNIPFTYLLKHIPTNKYYYGVRFKKGCHPNDFWTKYFTSSKKVKGLIKKYGKKSFIFEIRKTFKTSQEAINWENKVLKRMKVIYRNDFLNLTNNKSIDPNYLSKIMMGKNNNFYGKKHTKETIEKLRLHNTGKNNPMYGKERTKEVKQKLRLANLGKKHTKESIKKMRIASTGKNNAMYGKKGKLAPNYGNKYSKETKEKIRLAKIAYWKKIKKNNIDLDHKSI
jgi:hypothetical protein